ncbi:unnamed protein product [Ilex paraguariensis]|uniref:Uncharacterized protein n=1 Tax=Ilex paraguariensis TaxID=185542 RepID=A0ABC8U7C1_9AQUA
MSLTRINSGAGFHVLNNYTRIKNWCDSSYNNWWKYDIFPHLDDINCKTLLASEYENFKFKARVDGSRKGKSLPTVAKAPSRLRKRETSKHCLNSQEQQVPKMLKVTTPVSRSANVRSVHPLNILESAKVSSSNESDHAFLLSRISKGIFKKHDIGSNHGRISSTIVPVDNPGSTKQTVQERCQTRATKAEYNLALCRARRWCKSYHYKVSHR